MHTLGKFQPKARQKTDKVIQPPSSHHPIQDADRASSMHASKELPSAEGYVEAPGSPLWQKAVDSDVNICLQGNQEISMEQVKHIIRVVRFTLDVSVCASNSVFFYLMDQMLKKHFSVLLIE